MNVHPTQPDPNFLLDQISDACYALDHNWRFTLVNSQAEELLGQPRDELLGRSCWDRFPEAIDQGLKEKYQQAIDSDEVESFLLPYPHHNRWYAVRAHPTPQGMLVLFHDDSRRIRQESRYRSLVEHSVDGITLVDAQFQPFYRSPANFRILGYPRETGQSLRPLPYHPEDLTRIREAVTALAPNDAVTLEFRGQHANGEWRWLRGTFTNRLDDQSINAVIINFHDITEQRALREESERKQAELLESNRQLKLRATRLDTLHRAFLTAANYKDLGATIRTILSSAIKGTVAAACAYVEATDELYCVSHHGLTDAMESLPTGVLRTLARRASDARIPLTYDATKAESADATLAQVADAGFRGVLALPFARGSATGAVTVLDRNAVYVDADSISYISTLTGYIAGVADMVTVLERLERSAHDYRALARFGQQIETINDIDELVTTGLRELLSQLRVDYATLAAVEGDHAIPRWRAGDASAEATDLLSRPIPLRQGTAAQAVATGKPVLVSDYVTFENRPRYLDPLRFTSVLTLPIETEDAGKYLFILASKDEHRQIDETGVSIAALFAQRIANAFERVAHLDEVKATREATFRSLGLALEHRDYETKGHTDRVVELTTRFGQALGFGAERLQALQWGAYLHDMGKLSVPDQILLKPGLLTADEFELIKRHPVTGAQMCSDIPFLPDSTLDVVRHHHEKWDGSGYPDRLSGEAIPLEARLFALVDVYDALRSDRPYRPAWSEEEIVAHLRKEAGSHFDPELVETFLELIGETRPADSSE